MRTPSHPEDRSAGDPREIDPADRGPLASLVLGWMFLFGMIGTGLVGPNRSSIERALHITHAQFGAGYAVTQIACAVAVLVLTIRAREFDGVKMLAAGLFLQWVGFAIVAASSTVFGVVGGWSIASLGMTLGAVANMITTRIWSSDPGRGVTLLHGVNGVGKVAGPLLATACLGVGWRSSLVLMSLSTLVLGGLLMRSRASSPPLGPSPSPERTTRRAAGLPIFWISIASFALLTGGNVAFAALVPVFYEARLGMDARASGMLLSAHLVGVASGRFIGLSLRRRLSDHSILRICLLFGLFIVPAITSVSVPLVVVSLFGVGCMFSAPWPIFYSRAARFFTSQPHLLDYGSALGGAVGSAALIYESSALLERSPGLAMAVGPAAVWVFAALYFAGPFSSRIDWR